MIIIHSGYPGYQECEQLKVWVNGGNVDEQYLQIMKQIILNNTYFFSHNATKRFVGEVFNKF